MTLTEIEELKQEQHNFHREWLTLNSEAAHSKIIISAVQIAYLAGQLLAEYEYIMGILEKIVADKRAAALPLSNHKANGCIDTHHMRVQTFLGGK